MTLRPETSYRLGAQQYHAVELHSQGLGLGRLRFGAAFFNRGASAVRIASQLYWCLLTVPAAQLAESSASCRWGSLEDDLNSETAFRNGTLQGA